MNNEYDEFYETRDVNLRNKLVVDNMNLVHSFVKKYNVSKEMQEDLVNVGSIGLIKAIDNFKPQLGYKFSTYAAFWIKEGVSKYMYRNFSSISFVKKRQSFIRIYSNLYKIGSISRLEDDSGVTYKDIKYLAGMAKTTIQEVELFFSLFRCIPIREDDATTSRIDDDVYKEEVRTHLHNSILSLNSLETKIIYLHVYGNMTFLAIAKKFNKSIDFVQKTYRKALNKIKDILTNNYGIESCLN